MTSAIAIAGVVGAAAIVGLVAIAWRRRRRRSRPASFEHVDQWYVDRERQRLDAIRRNAASDYTPKRHEKGSR